MLNARVIAAVMAGCLVSAPLSAATMKFHADMLSASEVPPTGTDGKGTADGSYDTVSHKLDYTLSWSGLSGPATMAHFHGPAAAGVNAGVVVPLGNNPISPLGGSATLTDAQAAQLQAGQWYANVHTPAHPKGEIRGQMLAK